MSDVRVTPQFEIEVGDFAELVARMSRFLTRLAAIPPFRAAEVGLADWVALSALAEADGISNNQLAKRLGVTGQRANQISRLLVSAGLIIVEQSPEDARKSIIRITDAGKGTLSRVNEQLLSLAASALKGNERSIRRANNSIRTLMKMVQPPRIKETQRTKSTNVHE